MSKRTDYKGLWRKEQEKNRVLTEQINFNLIPRLKRAELVLYGIVFDEVDIEKMKEEYFKNNPNAKKQHDEMVEANKKGENDNIKS